jgi:hypothetical protein
MQNLSFEDWTMCHRGFSGTVQIRVPDDALVVSEMGGTTLNIPALVLLAFAAAAVRAARIAEIEAASELELLGLPRF